MNAKTDEKHPPQTKGNEDRSSPAIDKQLSPAAPGEERTPDKTIGEIKYARDDAAKK